MSKIIQTWVNGEIVNTVVSDATWYRSVMGNRIRLDDDTVIYDPDDIGSSTVVYDYRTAIDAEVEAEYPIYVAELEAVATNAEQAFQTAKDAYIALRDYTPTTVGQITGAGNQTAIVSEVEARVIAIETALNDIFKIFKYLKIAGVAQNRE